MTINQAERKIQNYMRIHYEVFMSDPTYFYDNALQESDKILCKAASDLRIEIEKLKNQN